MFNNRDSKRRPRRRDSREDKEFDQQIIDIARVTRVMKGGKRMSFRACVAIGDKKGRVGVALGKGADVTSAITKAVNQAKKKLLTVPIVNETIPHDVRWKFKAAKLLLKPAPKGSGIIAGGVMRSVLGLAGIGNVVAKNLGSKNKVNIAKATIEALASLRKVKAPVEKPAFAKASAGEEKADKKEENKKK